MATGVSQAHRDGAHAGALYAFAFLSGVAALAYQIAWTKLLSLTFGGTTLAASAAIAGFMGGMGVGAWASHRLLRRSSSALDVYGRIELGIAVSAFALTLGLPSLPALIASLPETMVAGPILVVLRFALVFALLAVPCALMGATFPLLSAALIHSRQGVGLHLGMLYGLNTLGAAFGALLTGLVLVEALGLRVTVLVGNALNLVVGLAALRLARDPGAQSEGAGSGAEETRIETTLPRALTGSVLLLSGFATLCYEILWFRAFTYLFGGSTYALTAMLFVFLCGLGLGPLSFRWVSRRGRPELDLALCQIGISAAAVLAVGLVALAVGSPDVTERVSAFSRAFLQRPWWQRLALDAAVGLGAMLPATALMGLAFPLASQLFLGDVRRIGRGLGGAVLLSNVGSILGALCAALWVLPQLGTVRGTHAVATLNLLLGVALLARATSARRARLTWACAGAGLLIALVAALPDRIRFVGSVGGDPAGNEIVFEQEGDLATVQVWQRRDDPSQLGMEIDGTIIGATSGWNESVYTKQILIAHLPFVLDTRIRHALTIGLGSASTLEAMASYPQLVTLDVVEINAPVVQAARLFPSAGALDDPRVRVIVDDGVHFLLRTRRRYDLIVSDGKQAMSFSGNAKLLSREFYHLARNRLSERGLFVQWVPLSIGSEEFPIIVRTLAEAFPELEVFFDPPRHVLFVGAQEPLADRPRMDPSAFRLDRTAQDLAPLHFPGPEALVARWVASREQLLASVGPGPVNTWDHPILEFTAYKQTPALWRRGSVEIMRTLQRAHGVEPSPADTSLVPGDTAAARATRLLRSAHLEGALGNLVEARRYAQRAVRADPSDPAARYWLGYFASFEGRGRAGAYSP